MQESIDQTPAENVEVLLVEDSPTDAEMVQLALRECRGAMELWRGRFHVSWVDCLCSALESLRRQSFHAVLLDLQLPDSVGLETLAQIRTTAGNVPIIVLTGFDDDGQALAAIQRGAQDYVSKESLDGRLLRRTIRHAIERKRAEVQLLRHAREVEAVHRRVEQQANELQARAEELDRINRELDDFTYIASHDLKEPLRGISAYCEILLEDYEDKLDAVGQQRLVTLVRLCNRLEALIGDLLTYCRVGGARPADTGIELDAVFKETLETLHPSIDRRGATVCVSGSLPVVSGDATLIGMALSNLISNGLKFNDRPHPRVEIGCFPTDPPTIYVRDNGIGIDEKHHQAVFTIFRRLHGRAKYDGTGAGLTIVKKIIESHGGRIWLESEPGVGTTFFFTLEPDRAEIPPKPAARPPHWLKHSAGSAPWERSRLSSSDAASSRK